MKERNDSFMIDIKQHKTVPYQPDKTLLESIELQNIDALFHCREGFCGACRTKLICGEVKYLSDPLAYIDDDEILPCCCVPISDITIELG
ncbi:MAG: ferredoxin [Paraglaciecola sp.]|jgi:ferredoxin